MNLGHELRRKLGRRPHFSGSGPPLFGGDFGRLFFTLPLLKRAKNCRVVAQLETISSSLPIALSLSLSLLVSWVVALSTD